jgi:uncharacterized membrane protein
VVPALSRGDRLLLVAALSAFGVLNASYLTWQWYEAASASWCDIDSFFSCTRVRESPWSAIGGIPTATVGVAGFAALLLLAVFGLRGTENLGPWSVDRWLLVFAVAGAGVGAGLTVVEVLVIQAVCVLCVFGFALDLAILGLAVTLRSADS